MDWTQDYISTERIGENNRFELVSVKYLVFSKTCLSCKLQPSFSSVLSLPFQHVRVVTQKISFSYEAILGYTHNFNLLSRDGLPTKLATKDFAMASSEKSIAMLLLLIYNMLVLTESIVPISKCLDACMPICMELQGSTDIDCDEGCKLGCEQIQGRGKVIGIDD
ncbi:hypothetical protein ACSBR1_025763 [Camellia fascicularis]